MPLRRRAGRAGPPAASASSPSSSSLSDDRNSQPILQIMMPPATCTTGTDSPNSLRIHCPASSATMHTQNAYSAILRTARRLPASSRWAKYGITTNAVPIGLTTGNNATKPTNSRWMKSWSA
jgi:hypothetical protein